MQSGDVLLDHLFRRAGFGASAADVQAVAGMSYTAAVDYFVDRHVREGRGDRLAFVDASRSLTYSELAAASARFAAGLQRRAESVVRSVGFST